MYFTSHLKIEYCLRRKKPPLIVRVGTASSHQEGGPVGKMAASKGQDWHTRQVQQLGMNGGGESPSVPHSNHESKLPFSESWHFPSRLPLKSVLHWVLLSRDQMEFKESKPTGNSKVSCYWLKWLRNSVLVLVTQSYPALCDPQKPDNFKIMSQ